MLTPDEMADFLLECLSDPFGPVHKDMLVSLITESDRGCVLVTAAVLDRSLELLLRAKFQSMSTVTDKELDFLLVDRPQPPLGSTSIKARVAFAMGVVTKGAHEAMLALNRLRSKVAAHSSLHFQLNQSHLDDIRKTLVMPQRLPAEDADVWEREHRGVQRPWSRERLCFVLYAVILISAIDNMRKRIEDDAAEKG